MVKRVGTDEPERKVLADIAKFGWHSLNIFADKDQPEYTFTIGLYETWKYPELLVMGLKPSIAHQILNIVATALGAGKRFDLSALNDDLLDGFACCFVQMPKRSYQEFVGFARWYYEGNGFPLYQIVWPSKEGHFPWNPLATENYRKLQPVLGEAPRGI